MRAGICLLILSLVLLTTLAPAQGRFSLGATAAPAYGYSDVRFNAVVPDNMGDFTTVTLASNARTAGYVFGVSGQYAFTPHWSVSAGFWYNRASQEAPFPFATGNVPVRVITQSFQLPLLINFRSGSNRLSPYFSAGVIAGVPRPTLYRGYFEADVLFSRTINYRTALVGAGLSCRFDPRLSLIAQPQLIWHFRPAGNYERYLAYQVNGQVQVQYSF